MNSSSSDLASLLYRCHDGIASILRQGSPSHHADALAELLHELLPRAVLTGCLLTSAESNFLAIRPENDPDSADKKRLLQNELSQLDPLALPLQTLPREVMPRVGIRAAALNINERPGGFLIIGLSQDTEEEIVARSEAVLASAESALSLRLSMAVLQHEQEELARFALVGQAFAGLAHELNNALNSMMLQTSVVQLRVDEQARQELTAIRHHGVQAAGLIRSLQHVIQERREKLYPVDLNSVLAEILEEDAALRRRVSPRLSAIATRIQSVRSAVKQLVRLLLEGVCAASQATVTAATDEQEGCASLSLTIAGAEDSESTVEALPWQQLDEIGRLAGQSLLRQLGGVLTSERSDAGVVIVRIVWARAL
ncbi:MAG: sensor histidine kinase [Gemmataceae bacterium]